VIDAPERGDGDEATAEEDDASGDSSAPPGPPRRVRDGFDRLEHWVGLAILAACVVYVFIQLGPSLVLRNTTITGGDTGAHVWFPDFLIDHFLPWRVSGWSNDFYAGFPAGQFYFPFPAVLIALLDIVLPYNIAFKLVTVVGPLALPAGAYVFARGIRAPRPTAPMLGRGRCPCRIRVQSSASSIQNRSPKAAITIRARSRPPMLSPQIAYNRSGAPQSTPATDPTPLRSRGRPGRRGGAGSQAGRRRRSATSRPSRTAACRSGS
jgi:hypothetical protein